MNSRRSLVQKLKSKRFPDGFLHCQIEAAPYETAYPRGTSVKIGEFIGY